MLKQKCKNFSGFFQIQKGKLQYLDSKNNDFFEIDIKFIQAVNIQPLEINKYLSQLDIVGNYEILRSICIPTNFAQKVKHWIYLHLHFSGRKDLLPFEVVQYRKKQGLMVFFFTLIALLLFTSLSKTISYTMQIKKLKEEAIKYSYSELLKESSKQIDKGEFTECIHSLLLANVLKPSPTIRSLLDNAYMKEGKFNLSIENISSAKQDFKYIVGLKKEIIPFLSIIKQYEMDRLLHFRDCTDLIQLSWENIMFCLDHGKNQARSEELTRTWIEFKAKLAFTRANIPLFKEIKDFFIITVH
jgi:hypothetical protein